jgi:Protein of unknown function (DUF3592)
VATASTTRRTVRRNWRTQLADARLAVHPFRIASDALESHGIILHENGRKRNGVNCAAKSRCQREPCRTIKFLRELKKEFPEILATDETRIKHRFLKMKIIRALQIVRRANSRKLRLNFFFLCQTKTSKGVVSLMRKTNLIFATIVVLGLAFFDGPLAKQLIQQYYSVNFSSTTGKVIHSEVSSYTTYAKYAHIHYFPKIRYSYKIDGQINESQRFCYTHYYSEEFSRKVVEDHPVGSQIQVFYNPQNPQDALLSTGFGQIDSAAIIRVLIQANFIIVIIVVVWCIKIRQRAKLSKQLPDS